MKTVGIICEYNPLHLGHKKQLAAVRQHFGEEAGIVCLMSGNFVQRGAPAVFDKSLRAKAAVLSGADLVLELPVRYALSSAEGFADGGVGILSGFCDVLSFGTETGDGEKLMHTAKQLRSEEFSAFLRATLDTGLSFPAARQAALKEMGGGSELLTKPNDILAVEYCKAILARGGKMEVFPVTRGGDYHDTALQPQEPSATALRHSMESGDAWLSYVPEEAAACFRNAGIHTLQAGERAVLAKLRTMTDEEFERLPHGSEGLWRKFMHESRREATVEDILTATKSKRYTRTRLDRMLMCAFLGITQRMMEEPAPYVRVLALNDKGREILKKARQTGTFLNAGQVTEDPWWAMEQQIGELYGLFSKDSPDAPGLERARRVVYLEK